MALHWNMEKVRERALLHNTPDKKGEDPPFPKGSYEDLEGDRQWGVSNTLIWATIGVDMGSITEKNYEEFYRRLVMLGTVYGSKYEITLADVKRRIGLSTNVSTITATAFDNKMKKLLKDDAERQLRSEARLLAEYEALVAKGDDLDEKEAQRKDELRVKHVEKFVEQARERARQIAEKEGASA